MSIDMSWLRETFGEPEDTLDEQEEENFDNPEEDLYEEGSALFEKDPSKWLFEQAVKAGEDLFIVKEGDDRYTAIVSKSTPYEAKMEITLDESGFLCLKICSAIIATEASEAPFRMIQMKANSALKNLGYIPAKAGEPVTFYVRIRPNEDIDLSQLINRGMSTLFGNAFAFEKINEAIEQGYDDELMAMLLNAMLNHT